MLLQSNLPLDWAAIIAALFALGGVIYSVRKQNKSAENLEGLKHELSQQHTLFTTRLNEEKEERIKSLEAALIKKERWETSREKGYAGIWNLTGSLNLFGPKTKIDIEDFSGRLKEWYFNHGLYLADDTKKKYFLIQEILQYVALKSGTFKRPANEILHNQEIRPLSVLRMLRSEYFDIDSDNDEIYGMGKYVDEWKKKRFKRKVQPVANWVLLQFVLSKFRSGLIRDLGSVLSNE